MNSVYNAITFDIFSDEANPLTSERSYVYRNVSIICQTDSGWSRTLLFGLI